ncbi:MAG: hypothetical protein CEE43_18845 [Promethearchaeota archaeon Loki_b32]|nr:MAG: hypothetical protein CEE43_18845 [Candidatus Lokiarchaeota archaeon Loki_b32]
MEYKDFSEEINNKIESIKNRVLAGEISLLDIDLVPIFENIKDSLTIYNISKYSSTYISAFQLLSQKFEELKIFLSYLDNQDKFLKFLKSNPKDIEIYQLFEDCWRDPFIIDALSLKFLEYSKDRLVTEKPEPLKIEHLDKINLKETFLLEIPEKRFTDKMLAFFNVIKDKLPCSYEEIFENERDQIKIFENFVYLLHLLQLNKIKYEKNTNMLYL